MQERHEINTVLTAQDNGFTAAMNNVIKLLRQVAAKNQAMASSIATIGSNFETALNPAVTAINSLENAMSSAEKKTSAFGRVLKGIETTYKLIQLCL